ncbi:MAG: hypothetical protein EXX96DRAFT_540893 [Benjaminiella poitrasii]|nr:MAG: hypothetical protein EXX96DRAFT_540893 [Benjaminiella poitrasii]
MSTFHPYEQEPTFSIKKSPKPNRKRYECNLCSKHFNRPSALQTHIYTHTGEKPHMCDIPGCGRRFAVISNLRRHLRVHQTTNVNRRLTSQERRKYVERLIQKFGGSIHDDHVHFHTFTSSSSSSPCSSDDGSSSFSPLSSPTNSPRYLYPVIENNYRLLKPKQTRPLCLTVKHLLN